MPINLELKSLLILHFGSQREAAMTLHIPENVLSYYVRGHRQPTQEHRKRLAKALGVSERKLFGNADGL